MCSYAAAEETYFAAALPSFVPSFPPSEMVLCAGAVDSTAMFPKRLPHSSMKLQTTSKTLLRAACAPGGIRTVKMATL
jgi:hypothetical protein